MNIHVYSVFKMDQYNFKYFNGFKRILSDFICWKTFMQIDSLFKY